MVRSNSVVFSSLVRKVSYTFEWTMKCSTLRNPPFNNFFFFVVEKLRNPILIFAFFSVKITQSEAISKNSQIHISSCWWNLNICVRKSVFHCVKHYHVAFERRSVKSDGMWAFVRHFFVTGSFLALPNDSDIRIFGKPLCPSYPTELVARFCSH